MNKQAASPLLVLGEIFVDFSLPRTDGESKLRLGGIVHAARGLWACGIDYSLAAICPAYLVDQARDYAHHHGCVEFIWLGEVKGAPNVIVIGDPTEVSHQGYEDLLRNSRTVTLFECSRELSSYSDIIIFPGHFDLVALRPQFIHTASFSFDIAYDVDDISALSAYKSGMQSIILSTSSKLFEELGSSDLNELLSTIRGLNAQSFLLKENRGGSRLFDLESGNVEEIPAELGRTENSVGVGDVYSAVFVAHANHGLADAAWRGARAATYYSKTTYPDDFRRNVQRDLKVSVKTLKGLWGTYLPWHQRQKVEIYLAAPDFSYANRPELDKAIQSLTYHNFRLRRPVQENGELPLNADLADRRQAFSKDFSLLKECNAVFAVPLDRDPGTLAEIGIALALSIPVVTFDPRRENNNCMIVAGSATYSTDLDICLNGLFTILSKPPGNLA